nr:SIS domain-containing protein [Mobilisporobacter senegalensis]
MIFGYSKEELEKLGAIHTATEIDQQPRLWMETVRIVEELQDKIVEFLKNKVDKDTRIIFTGAGSSYHVGNTICPHINRIVNARVESIATTDIVSNPMDILEEDTKTILVSFARSGNSPESIGAFQICQNNIKNITHLVITCNKDGNLAKMASEHEENFVILLPEETNDLAFAMTSSFSCMFLTGLLFFDIEHIKENKKIVEIIAHQGTEILKNEWQNVKLLAESKPKRIIYLGSGCFRELASELALKNLELTNGKIATMQEAILAFRHGPKTFINDSTLIIVLNSLDDYTNLYIYDLIKEIHNDVGEQKIAVMSYLDDNKLADICDKYLTMKGTVVPEVYACLNYALYGQMLGLFNSILVGNTPDNPNPDGTVNRVVKGVILHDYNN